MKYYRIASHQEHISVEAEEGLNIDDVCALGGTV